MGCCLKNFIRAALIGSLWDPILAFRSCMPGRPSNGCIGSKVAFSCWVVCFSTCLTGWVNIFRLSFSSVTVFVLHVNIVDVAVRFRVIGVTVFFQDYFDSFQFVLAVFSTSDTDFCKLLFFYSGATLIWFCRH